MFEVWDQCIPKRKTKQEDASFNLHFYDKMQNPKCCFNTGNISETCSEICKLVTFDQIYIF